MTPVDVAETVAGALHEEIADGWRLLPRRLRDSQAAEIADPDWRVAAEFCAGLSPEQLAGLQRLLRIACVDTASTILAVIEGDRVPDALGGDFELIYDGRMIGADVCDAFLEIDEADRASN